MSPASSTVEAPCCHCEFPKRSDGRLPGILEQRRNFRFEVIEYFADLEIGGMDQSHILNDFYCARFGLQFSRHLGRVVLMSRFFV